MSDLVAFLLSPQGIALYIGFWICKILFGAWALRKIVLMLPDRIQGRIAARFGFLGLGGPNDWMR
ncbi:hypothetical protein [Pseudoprimorskyibacter insulae]|uniref:Uncharacterized protein n=1 Tax=Pseudoprimorskyibacter insulae TaxID=1695997 RepID=A0A2R8AWV6_9RHOB|nr:hypothetical protein [Pseudoprimorskyibacter insulae]SPF80536.1 hypothetical protein PRI8871_02346 [Pseudoprimorskyibacter insulae]